MKIFLAEEMRKVDTKAIEKIGMPELVLMENAGAAVANAAESYLEDLNSKQVVILVGKGNNGGDGLVAARLLTKRGALVTVVLAEAPSKFGVSPAAEYKILQHSLVEIMTWPKKQEDKERVLEICAEADLVIDGLLGTGFKGELRGSYKEIISLMPEGVPVLAIDIPSGVEADTGKVDEALVASLTVTMIAPKLGLYLYPGAAYSGDIWVGDLGTSGILVEEAPCKHNLVTADLVEGILPRRPVTAHKGMNGRVTVLAGAKGYIGAAELTSKAVVRAGGGLVHLYTDPEVADILATKLTEVMVEERPASVAETIGATLTSDVLAVGPGLGKDEAKQEMLRELLLEVGMPVVLDADGLNSYAGHAGELKNISTKVLTPHPAELARLMDCSTADIVEAPIDMAVKAAKKFNAIVLLKTVPALVAEPTGRVYVNTTGNEGMATGGSGDVLTGVIAAFMGQGLDPLEAAVAGMYIHGLAGNFASKKGKIGLRASDLIEHLPQAIKYALEGEPYSEV